MATEKNLYEIFGLDPSASEAEIRRRYRELARRLHPDLSGGSAPDGVTMSEVNHAWSILSDRDRRRAYDASITVSRSTGSAAGRGGVDASASDRTRNFEVPPLPRARFPWRAIVGFAVVASLVVLVLHQFSEPPAPGVPDQLLEPGSCVTINAQSMAVEVSCASDHDYVVSRFIPADGTCPMDTRAFQDRQGMGLACVVEAPTPDRVVTPGTTR